MSHCQSLRIALYRVFVRPALLNPSVPCLLPSAASQWRSNTTVQWPLVEPGQQDAAIHNDPPKKRSYKDRLAEREAARSPFAQTRITQAPKIKGAPDRPPQDLEIRSKYIAYVDREGMFNPRVWRDDVLKMLDPRSEHLVQVESADPDDPRSLPKCKIVSKSYIREKAKAAQDSAKERSKAERSGKIVELNWAIAPGDLEMKLNKVCTFLEEGRKVDVMIAPKKRKRVANKEEMEEVLRRMIESVETVEGVTQIATPEGNVGGTMVYYFEKRK